MSTPPDMLRRLKTVEAKLERIAISAAATGVGVTRNVLNTILDSYPTLAGMGVAIAAAIAPGTKTALAYGAGWVDVSTYQPGSWWRDAFGVIHLEGTVRFTPGTLTTTIATLPVGARPTAIRQFPCRGGDGSITYVHVRPTGVIEFGGTLAAANGSATLDGITFDTR